MADELNADTHYDLGERILFNTAHELQLVSRLLRYIWLLDGQSIIYGAVEDVMTLVFLVV